MFMTLYGKRCGQHLSFHLCSRKRWVQLCRCDDVMTFESFTADAISVRDRERSGSVV